MQIIKRNNDDNKVIYKPFRSVFDDFFMSPLDDFFTLSPSTTRALNADMWEQDEKVFVKMALPGLKEDDVKIKVEDNMLSISASRKEEEKEDSSKKYYYRSMESSYEQRFNLPCKVDSDKAEAKMENGVLTITLPKAEELKAKEIKVSR